MKAKKRSSPVYPVVRILDPLMVYDNINLGRRIDPVWPDPEWRAKGNLSILLTYLTFHLHIDVLFEV